MTENIESMLNAPDDEVRREAALFLQEHIHSFEAGRAIKMLVQALRDPSWRVRKTAADILVQAYPLDLYFDQVLQLLYDPDNAGARNSAIEVFVKVGHSSAEKLFEAFNTDDADVRKFIIDIAGEVAHRSMIPLLMSALKDENENVKASAVEHLGELKEPQVVDSLIEILSEKDLWTSYPAIEALGRISDIRALPHLIESLGDKFLREPAIRALGSLDGEKVVVSIVPYLDDNSRAVRQVAFSSLARVYEKGVSGDYIRNEIETHYGSDVQDLIIESAGSDNEDLRLSALILMGMMGNESAVEPLLAAAYDGVDEELVVRSLVHIGKRTPQTILGRLEIARDDPFAMRILVSTLASMSLPDCREALNGLLKYPDGHVRAMAAEGLGNLGDKESVSYLVEAVYDKYEDVRASVVEALVKLNAGLRPEVLQSFVDDSRPEIRKLAVPLLAGSDKNKALKAISLLLKDPSSVVRRAAVDYFKGGLDEESTSLLLQASADESPDVRSAIAIKLGETRDPGHMGPLEDLLSDDVDMVRVSACKGLGLMGDSGALDSLALLLSDSNGFVVASSIEAISRIGGEGALDIITGMLLSPDSEIRRTAIRALSGFEEAKDSVIKYLDSDDWATRFEVIKVLAPYVHDNVIYEEIRSAYRSEADSVVREAMKEALDV